MNLYRRICRAVLTLLAFAPIARADEPEPPKPTARTSQKVQGWTVQVDDRLRTGPDAELGRKALGLLEGQLKNVVGIVPGDKVKRLREVSITLDLTHGKLKNPQYHPSAHWLEEHGYEPSLAKSVHIPDASYFVNARFQRSQPWAVMHELAHAYHDQVLGFDNAEIKAAWKAFKKEGGHEAAKHVDGKPQRHYGLTNPQEFFAEMTESYFGQNDFYPFNSTELRKSEPAIFEMLAKIWGPLP